MDDSNFLNDLADAKVTERGEYLKAGQGIAVLESFHRGVTRAGDTAFLVLKVLKVTPKPNKQANLPGETATKQFQFEKKSSPDYRAAVFGSFKRVLCSIDGSDYKNVTNDKLAKMLKSGCPSEVKGVPTPHGCYRGMLINFESYEAKAKDTGESRDYHNFTVPAQDPKDVAKRATLLDKNAGVEAFL